MKLAKASIRYVIGRLPAGACEQIPWTIRPERGHIFNSYSYFRCWCVCKWVSIDLSPRTPPKHTDFESDGVCGGPLFARPSTSARIQSRFEFVELGGGMCSNYQGDVPGLTGITGWYQVPGTIYDSTLYMYENIWYVQVPGSPVAYV